MSIWCCNKANKVEDDKATVVVSSGNSTVFVFVSANVAARCLLGSFIQTLEKKGLVSAKIVFKSGSPADFLKSNLFKTNHKSDKFNHLGVFMVWAGENAFGRVTEVVHRFGNQHTIPKIDILFTTSPTETKKEIDLWFEKDPPSLLSKAPEAVTPPQPEASPAVEEAPPAEASPEAPPPHGEEPLPTYEDAATAEVEAITADQAAHPEEQK